MKKFLTTITLLIGFSITIQLHAQTSNLSIQGVLRTAEGTAVENGEYDITFKLYTQEYGSAPLWDEEIIGVQVKGGVYSVVLGSNGTELDVPFDEPYFLGVTVEGGIELTPRAKLTSSPYALSLIGDDNIFPNTGNVGVGADNPQHKLTVQRKNAILGLEADSMANHIAIISTTPEGMQFDAGGVDNIYAFSNGRIDATADEQFTIEGTDDANIVFSKTGGNASLGFENANGNDLILSNAVGGITLNSIDNPVKINKNGEALQLIGSDSSFISFYPQGTNNTTTAKIGYIDTDNPNNFSMTTSGDDIIIDTKGGALKVYNYMEVGEHGWLTRTENAPIGWFANNSGWSGGYASGSINMNASFYAYNRVVGDSFFAISDERTKKDFSSSINKMDLETLKQIKVTDYQHIDVFNKGNAVKKGLIAQQVKSVYPQAVSLRRGHIPSVFSFSTHIDSKENKYKITLENPHGLKINDKVKVITLTGEESITVSQIHDDFSFSVIPKEIKIEDKVFIYGKEVDDFHTVDYDRVFTLNVSATQELARKVEALEKENARLKNKSYKAEQVNLDLKTELKGMNKRLQAIELMIDATGSK